MMMLLLFSDDKHPGGPAWAPHTDDDSPGRGWEGETNSALEKRKGHCVTEPDHSASVKKGNGHKLYSYTMNQKALMTLPCHYPSHPSRPGHAHLPPHQQCLKCSFLPHLLYMR
ncbi:hypothetical protein E2C01_018054 [Portunus trituberculatus]|uniref:Uncharacterized protein n=1 Tax=Portunus trituberculatus TaxID=210409 RepID=A0A5B7DU29_PORTR|nr:hypothetical protein [Portunus trituberculatus]